MLKVSAKQGAVFVALSGLLLLCGLARGQGTAFTYQGNLNYSGTPANGAYDLEFALYDAPTNGNQVGPALTNSATTVSNGSFFVVLDFGNVFNGSNYWLQIAAQTNGGDGFTVLTPLQPITSVPYATTAANALRLVGSLPVSQISGTLPLSQLPPSIITNGATGLNLTGTFAGSAAGLTGMFATNLVSDTTILSMIVTNSAPAPSNNWAFYAMSENSSNFLTVGGPVDSGDNGPGLYFDPLYFQTGASGLPGVEYANAMSESFEMDGSQFVFGLLGQGRTFDIVVDDVDNVVTNTLPPDGNPYWINVTFATAATRTITLRDAYGFCGVYVPITNGCFPPQTLASRMVVLGDSFAEQDYTAGSQCLGLVSQMQTLLPQVDIWALGQGGTGFVTPGPSGRTNFLGRVNDVIHATPQYVLIYGGINDSGIATDTTVTNPIYINATNLLCTLKVALPAAQIAVIGPQWPRTPSPTGDADIFNCGILLSNACSACAVPYISPILNPWITGNVAAPDSGNADVYTLSSDGTHPTIPQGAKYLAHRIVSSLSQIWNLTNLASPASSSAGSIVSTVTLPVPANGIFWNSNGVLYWVTSSRTNYLSGP